MNRAHQCSIDTINLAYVLTMKRLQEISEDWRSAVGGREHTLAHTCVKNKQEAGKAAVRRKLGKRNFWGIMKKGRRGEGTGIGM